MVDFPQGVVESGEFVSGLHPSVGDMVHSSELSTKDLAGFIKGHDITGVLDIGGEGVFSGHAKGSDGA
eukprot:14086479-Heterocapsa_arctica.AAC.1